MDSVRKHKPEAEQQSTVAQSPVPAEPPAPPPAPENLSVNGLIKRSDGRSTVWINGKPVNSRAPLSGGRTITGVGSGGRVAVRMPDTKHHVELKVGQHLDGSSGAIRENLSKQPERFEANVGEIESAHEEEPTHGPDAGEEITGEDSTDPELSEQPSYERELRDTRRREALEAARTKESRTRR